MQELKPCPFCGCKAMLVGGGSSSRGIVPAHIECASRLCMAATRPAVSADAAAAIWNERTDAKKSP